MCLFWKAKANSKLDKRFAKYRLITAEEFEKEKKNLGKGLEEMNIDEIHFVIKGRRPPLDIYSIRRNSVVTHRAKIGGYVLPRFTNREIDQILIIDGSLTLVKTDPEKKKRNKGIVIGNGKGHVILK